MYLQEITSIVNTRFLPWFLPVTLGFPSETPSSPASASAVLALRRGGPGTARRGGLLCLVQMASAGHATPTAPTRTDAGALSAAKTPAFRPLNYDAATATASISLKDLTDTWQKQCTYPQEADALVEEKRPARVRCCVVKGLGVLQTLLGQPNTQHRSRRDGIEPLRPDTEGGQVSVPTPSLMPAMPCA